MDSHCTATGNASSDRQPHDTTAAAALCPPVSNKSAIGGTAASPQHHFLGQLVQIKGSSTGSRKARVLSGPSEVGDFPGRCLVETIGEDGRPNGQTRHIYPRHLQLLREPPSRVLVVETTRDYREAAVAFSHPDDVVLEVGCHFGVTSHALHRRVSYVVGVDKSKDNVSEARRRYPGVRFEPADGFDLPRLKAMSPRFHQQQQQAQEQAQEQEQEQQQKQQRQNQGQEQQQRRQNQVQEQQQRRQEGPSGAEDASGHVAGAAAPCQGPSRAGRGGAAPDTSAQCASRPEPAARVQGQGQNVGSRRRRPGRRRDPPLFSKIFVDVGGIAELHTVMALVGLYDRHFRGAVIVVKSKYLKNMLGRTSVWHPSMLGLDGPPAAAPGAQQQQQQQDSDEG